MTGKSIFDIILMIEGHLEGQNVNFKVKMQKYNLKTIQLASDLVPHFRVIFTV